MWIAMYCDHVVIGHKKLLNLYCPSNVWPSEMWSLCFHQCPSNWNNRFSIYFAISRSKATFSWVFTVDIVSSSVSSSYYWLFDFGLSLCSLPIGWSLPWPPSLAVCDNLSLVTVWTVKFVRHLAIVSWTLCIRRRKSGCLIPTVTAGSLSVNVSDFQGVYLGQLGSASSEVQGRLITVKSEKREAGVLEGSRWVMEGIVYYN